MGADPLEDEEAAREEEGALEERGYPCPVKNDSFSYTRSPSGSPPPPFLDRLPVGSRLGACLSMWWEIQADPWTLDLITQGLPLLFVSPPPLSQTPLIFSHFNDREKQWSLVSAVMDMLKKKVIEPVSHTNSPGFYNRLFLMPKKEGTWSPIKDLSSLKKYC